MIERVIRQFYPEFDTSPILNIRLLNDPEIREAILWEYGLTPLLPFAVEPSLIEGQAIDFIRIRGTPLAIRMALAWVGFPNITFAPLTKSDYEIDPGRVPTEREIKAIRAALSVSVQSRGILKRVFHGSFEVKYG
ncbi:MAG TPA: hypothetical protein VE954_21960 [Oligoflexus sp.]|uniref:hypothetical protein n=1 Tax=Oligoflexus sp. TaxID=1971216 RepID=UPI002D2D8681|nr:hypothetical protein [Oligoflexus sp.]HYX35772.1 hypothetical protein [Oligoflexus sp.]